VIKPLGNAGKKSALSPAACNFPVYHITGRVISINAEQKSFFFNSILNGPPLIPYKLLCAIHPGKPFRAS
jgi:hypothetical protein